MSMVFKTRKTFASFLVVPPENEWNSFLPVVLSCKFYVNVVGGYDEVTATDQR